MIMYVDCKPTFTPLHTLVGVAIAAHSVANKIIVFAFKGMFFEFSAFIYNYQDQRVFSLEFYGDTYLHTLSIDNEKKQVVGKFFNGSRGTWDLSGHLIQYQANEEFNLQVKKTYYLNHCNLKVIYSGATIELWDADVTLAKTIALPKKIPIIQMTVGPEAYQIVVTQLDPNGNCCTTRVELA